MPTTLQAVFCLALLLSPWPALISAVPLDSEDDNNNNPSLPPLSIDNSSHPLLLLLLKRSPIRQPKNPPATRGPPEVDEDGYLRPAAPRSGTYENVRPIHPGTRPRQPSPTPPSSRRPRMRFLTEPQRPSRLRRMAAFFHGLVSPNQGRPWPQSSPRQRHRQDSPERSMRRFPDEIPLPGEESRALLSFGRQDQDSSTTAPALPPPRMRQRPKPTAPRPQDIEQGTTEPSSVCPPLEEAGKEKGPVKLKAWPESLPTGRRPRHWPRIATDREDDDDRSDNDRVYRFQDRNGQVHWSFPSPDSVFLLDSTTPADLFPHPSPSRLLPPPRPTGYSPDGVPQYEHWLWVTRSGDGQRAFQLVPKAAGCYTPLRGSIGSTEGFCDNEDAKPVEAGYIPLLFRFPGATGSEWHFAPQPASASPSPEPIAGPSRPRQTTSLTTAQGGRNGRGGGGRKTGKGAVAEDFSLVLSRLLTFLLSSGLSLAQAQAINQGLQNMQGSTGELVQSLLYDIFTYVGCFVEYDGYLPDNVGALVVAYMPHLVDVILMLLHSTTPSNNGHRSKRGEATTSLSTDRLAEGFCTRFRTCQMGIPEDFQTSLYLDCARSTAGDPVDLSLNMFSRKAVCDAFAKAENRTGMLPAIDIDCSWDQDPAKQHPSVYMCNNNNFQGPCTTVAASLGQC
ncbi:hypothetical protein L249_4935, partial [Ophiocordyceps polyrhachis-furcata BCC 54312]